MLILLWNPPPWGPPPGPVEDGSPALLTHDRAALATAHAVVFHVPTLPARLRLPRPARQRWVAWSMESEVMYPQLADPAFMAAFDLTMTYRMDSDVPVPYAGPRLAKALLDPPQEKTEAAPAVFFASSAVERSGRTEYVRQLMQHLAVDSYGRCLRNRVLTEDRGAETKRRTIARYRFTLAFENSCTRDYVTEKFYAPLCVGSVPVVLGAPNIDQLAPADNCYLDVRDFSDPAALAARLLALSRDPRAYEELLAWKTRPLRARFARRIQSLAAPAFSRLASRLAAP